MVEAIKGLEPQGIIMDFYPVTNILINYKSGGFDYVNLYITKKDLKAGKLIAERIKKGKETLLQRIYRRIRWQRK